MIYHCHSNPNRPKEDIWWNVRLVRMNEREMKILPVIYSDGKHQVVLDGNLFTVTPSMVQEAFDNAPIEN